MIILNKRQIKKHGLITPVKKILQSNLSEEEMQIKIDNLIREALDKWNVYHRELYNNNESVRKVFSDRAKETHRINKAWIYKKRGGCCEICGSKKNLDFAHRDPTLKKDNLTHLIGRPDYQTNPMCREETDKCDLLCRSCHFLYDRTWAKLYPHLHNEVGYLRFIKARNLYFNEGCKGSFKTFLVRKKYFGNP